MQPALHKLHGIVKVHYSIKMGLFTIITLGWEVDVKSIQVCLALLTVQTVSMEPVRNAELQFVSFFICQIVKQTKSSAINCNKSNKRLIRMLLKVPH